MRCGTSEVLIDVFDEDHTELRSLLISLGPEKSQQISHSLKIDKMDLLQDVCL